MRELEARLHAAIRTVTRSRYDQLEELVLVAVLLQDPNRLDRLHVVEAADPIEIRHAGGQTVRVFAGRPAAVASDWSGHLSPRTDEVQLDHVRRTWKALRQPQ